MDFMTELELFPQNLPNPFTALDSLGQPFQGRIGGSLPKNLEVVVVDPDVNSRADTNRALTMAHFTVSGEAGYGIDAVTMAQEKNPDVIVLAMEEPVARAAQTMSALADALPETPIIVYSSLSDAASVRRAMVSGARDYLVKPPRPEELARAIYSVLEQEERRRTRLTGETASSARAAP